VFNTKVELLEGLTASLDAVHIFTILLRFYTPIIIQSFKKHAYRRKWKGKDKGTKYGNTRKERKKERKESSSTTKLYAHNSLGN
jgi:hypothetical protein